MNPDIQHNRAARESVATVVHFPPLELENRPAVPTEQAAYYLTRQKQTLRSWACRENGPLRPLRVNGRLAWPTAEIRRLLGVTA
jgi:hypothetical protein